MRAVTAIALLALLLIGSCSATIKHAAPAPTSPWQIVQDWNVTLPGPGMQIFPTYCNVPGIYIATTSGGTVTAVNTSERAIQWKQTYDDIAFVSALPATNTIFVARYSGTTVLNAFTGEVVWHSTNITMAPNLAEDYNALVFGTTIVYRDQSNGYVRLCAVDGKTGTKKWCDSRRTLGSPDAAMNNTFTAQFFDVNGSAYVANMNADDGTENWFAFADRILTGSDKWVGLIWNKKIWIINSMTGLAGSTFDISNIANIGNSVFVKEDIFSFTDGTFWIAAIECTSGKLLWNVTAMEPNLLRRVEMQHRGENILVAASLSFTHTNFTRFNALTGEPEWTISAKPTGMSLAPVHAWLNNDILYTRNTDDTWSAWGADSGLLIAHGQGDLFLPRSVMSSFDRPHFSFYVSTASGQMIDLRVERK